jgi:hypothetical protein
MAKTTSKTPKSVPSWWQAVKDKLNLQPLNSTLNSPPKPKPPLTGSFTAGGGTMAQGANGQTVNIPKPPTSNTPSWLPAWLQPKPPTSGNPYQTLTTNPYNATPPKPAIPTGSFISGGGQFVLGSQQQAVPTAIPTGSFLAGGGSLVLGPNQQAYNRDQTPNGTFIGAGGEAMRGPDTAIADITPPPSSDGGSGYGYDYKAKRRGSGSGNYDGYERTAYPQRQNNLPAWARGLANWSIG